MISEHPDVVLLTLKACSERTESWTVYKIRIRGFRSCDQVHRVLISLLSSYSVI